MKKNPHIGRSVQQDLRRDLRDPDFAQAFYQIKSKLALRDKLRTVAQRKHLGVRELARRMGTSPAQVVRLFSSPSESYRIDTLIRFSVAVGKHLDISFK